MSRPSSFRLRAAALGLALTACADAPTAHRADAPLSPADAPRASLTGSTSRIAPALAASLAGVAPTERVEVIVNFEEGATTSTTLVAALHRLGGAVRPFRNLSIVAAYLPAGQVAVAAALPGVSGVYANEREPLLMFESRATIKADRVETELGITGQGVGVAIMDSGVDATHPDLALGTKTVQNVKFQGDVANLYCQPGAPCLHSDLYTENVANTDNSSGHGTHVAGTVAGGGTGSRAKYRGVAPGAHLVGLGVGEGLSIVNVMVLGAVDWLLDNHRKYNVQVVNNSWGGTGTFDPNDPINEAMRRLHDVGITVVFAAGNDGPAENTMNRRSVAPWVISVAAGCKFGVYDVTNSQSQCNDGRQRMLANFSSRGIPGDPLQHPDITAPGVRIVSTRSSTGFLLNGLDAPSDLRSCGIPTDFIDKYTCSSGTSMAAPHVAGVAALMEQAARGSLTPTQTLSALQATATPMPGYGEWEVGAGYVDALAAVRRVRR